MDKAISTISKKENQIISKIKDVALSFFQKSSTEDKLSIEKKELLQDIEKALADLRYARNCFESASNPEVIEACVYEIKSAEARYSFLLRKAKLLSEHSEKVSI